MGHAKLEKPPGMCPQCGYVAMDIGSTTCPVCAATKRPHALRSTINIGDWAECEQCGATGVRDGNPCAHCNEIGWLFVRPGGFDGRRPIGLPMRGRRYLR